MSELKIIAWFLATGLLALCSVAICHHNPNVDGLPPVLYAINIIWLVVWLFYAVGKSLDLFE